MKKKLVLVLLLATLIAGGAFAQFNLSAGLGGNFSASFLNYAWTKDGKDALKLSDTPTNVIDQNLVGAGFFGYFDATYVMVSLGFSFYDLRYANADTQREATYGGNVTFSLTTFDIGVLGKYPIPIGSASIFPMLGGDFKIATAYTAKIWGIRLNYADDYKIGEYFSTVWLKFGVGADIPLGDKLYIRPMFLYGFGTVPKYLKKYVLDDINEDKKLADIIHHGFDIKVAVGWKFL